MVKGEEALKHPVTDCNGFINLLTLNCTIAVLGQGRIVCVGSEPQSMKIFNFRREGRGVGERVE